MPAELMITELPESTDQRGLSFSVPEETLGRLAEIRDVHIAAIGPGHIRGNHYHARKAELITVVYQDIWSLHWDTGPGTAVTKRHFPGRGAVSISVPLYWSHAVKNDGHKDLWIFVAADRSADRSSLDPVARDALPREVVALFPQA